MVNFKKVRHNPVELIKKFWPEVSTDHIRYDPDLKGYS